MLPAQLKLIIEAYTPKPKVQHLNEVYDFKRLCMDGDGIQSKVLAPLNNISFNHVFLIKRSSMNHNTTLLYAKQYSSTSQWEPQQGCRLLLHFPNAEIHGAEQMSYDDHKKLAFDSSNYEQKIYWMQCLQKYWAHQEVCLWLECGMVGYFFWSSA